MNLSPFSSTPGLRRCLSRNPGSIAIVRTDTSTHVPPGPHACTQQSPLHCWTREFSWASQCVSNVVLPEGQTLLHTMLNKLWCGTVLSSHPQPSHRGGHGCTVGVVCVCVCGCCVCVCVVCVCVCAGCCVLCVVCVLCVGLCVPVEV